MMSEFEKFKANMFDDGEWTCFGQQHTAVACNPIHLLTSGEHQLVGLNPMVNSRRDSNVQVFRNILVEQDVGSVDEQIQYIKEMGFPYSSAVYSGNKSVHFLVSLDKPLPDLRSYKFVSKWILRILSKADQATINPSRFTRVPGTLRTSGKMQELVDLGNRIQRETLNVWLNSFPKEKPTEIVHSFTSTDRSPLSLPRTALIWLANNEFPEGERNSRWWWIACRCKEAGLALDQTIVELEGFFQEEQSFKRDEWIRAINSAYRKI